MSTSKHKHLFLKNIPKQGNHRKQTSLPAPYTTHNEYLTLSFSKIWLESMQNYQLLCYAFVACHLGMHMMLQKDHIFC